MLAGIVWTTAALTLAPAGIDCKRIRINKAGDRSIAASGFSVQHELAAAIFGCSLMCGSMTASLAPIFAAASSISSIGFSDTFVFVHAFIRPAYRVVDRRIAGGIVCRDSDGDSRLFPPVLGGDTDFLADCLEAVS